MHEDCPSKVSAIDTGTGPGQWARISLPSVLNSAAAVGLSSNLLAVRGRPVRIDAGEVKQIGGLCLQVLLSAGKTWASDNIDFALTPVSQPLRDQVSLLGADLLFDSVGAEA